MGHVFDLLLEEVILRTGLHKANTVKFYMYLFVWTGPKISTGVIFIRNRRITSAIYKSSASKALDRKFETI